MKIPAGLSRLILKLHGVIYIVLSPDHLIVRSVGTERKFDDIPLMAISVEDTAQISSHLIHAVGHVSEEAVKEISGSSLCRPFYHPRLLVSNYPAAEALLNYAAISTYGSSWAILWRMLFKPFVIMHPTVEYEDGLTSLEFRTLIELGFNVPGKEVYIWTGKRLLTDDEILSGQFPYNAWNGQAPWWQQGKTAA